MYNFWRHLNLVVLLLPVAYTGCWSVTSQSSKGDIANQNSVSPTQDANTSISEPIRLVKAEGWKIPSHPKFALFKKRYRVHDLDIKPLDAYATWFRKDGDPRHQIVLGDDYFTKDQLNELGIVSMKMIVSDIIKYDVDNKIFCYVVHTYPFGFPATRQLVYYDENGDGRFEVVESGTWQTVPRVPKWVIIR